jgi:DNA-binding GntR family transcriptional regulator
VSHRIRIESLVDRVHAVLREWILAGELAPGTRLRQTALADDLGISRTPLREALRLLAAEGLVTLQPQRGAVVADLTAADVRAAWEARLAVEPACARLAALRRPAEALAAMRQAITDQRAGPHEPAAMFVANRGFHLALAAASGNPQLAAFLASIWVPRIALTILGRQGLTFEQDLRYAAEHEAIADAVDAGDPERAARLTHEHIRAAAPAAALDPQPQPSSATTGLRSTGAPPIEISTTSPGRR